MNPTVIMRPRFDAEAYAEREVERQVRNERVEEIRRLMVHHDALSLGIFLEERAAYRELVSRCAHRGVAEPKQPKYYDVGKRVERAVPRGAAPTTRPTGQPTRVARFFGDTEMVVY